MKIYPFTTLNWMNKDIIAQQIFPAHGTIYSSQLLETNFLSETAISEAKPAFICSNSTTLIVE